MSAHSAEPATGDTVSRAYVRRWSSVARVPAKLIVEKQVLKRLSDRERPGTSICNEDLSCLNLRDVPWPGVPFPSGHLIITFGIGWLIASLLNLPVGVPDRSRPKAAQISS